MKLFYIKMYYDILLIKLLNSIHTIQYANKQQGKA